MGTHRAPRRTSRLGVVPSRWRGVAVAGVAALGLGSLVAASGAGTRAEISCARLSPGAAGPAVATVQRAVGVTVDGEYGPATKAAVEAWQHRRGVPQTGAVDPATWLALPKPVTWAACGQAVHRHRVARLVDPEIGLDRRCRRGSAR